MHPHLPTAAPASTRGAYDSVVVEYRNVRREPRTVFDGLVRTAFETCASLAEVISRQLGTAYHPRRMKVECGLEPNGPGAYLVSFEISAAPPPPVRDCLVARMRARRAASAPPTPDEAQAQVELLFTTRMFEDLILAVDTICSMAPGSLDASVEDGAQGQMVEFLDGVRVLRRIHLSAWRLLGLSEVQSLLRETLTPFLDPQLYTMTVHEVVPLGGPGTSWVITSSRQLRSFVEGGHLDLPRLRS